MTNILSIANKLKISTSTVSRAIRHPNMVAVATRNLIIKEALAQGYIKDPKLKAKQSYVGVLLSDLSSIFSSTLLSTILEYLQSSNINVLIACSKEKVVLENKILKSWLSLNLSGAIVVPANTKSKFLKYFVNQVDSVILDRDVKDVKADKVLVNNANGISIAINHLKDLGHKNILFICGNISIDSYKQRYEAADPNNYLPSVIKRVILRSYTHSECYMDAFEYINQLIKSNKGLPSAIVVGNSAVGMGVAYALKLNDIDIGKTVSLVIYDDSTWSKFFSPSLTCICQPVEQMGITAVNILLERLKQTTDKNKTIILDPMLILRESSKATSNF